MILLKNWVKRLLTHCFVTDSPEAVIAKIQGYHYVSFDVFDTLLKRQVVRPEDVFTLMEKELHESGFAAARIRAERLVRHLHPEREVTLAEIYAQLSPQYVDYMSHEIDIEHRVSRPNFWIQPVLEFCRSQDCYIIAISDMYLQQEEVQGLLQQNGMAVDQLFVSSTTGHTKVRGDLYHEVMQALQIRSEELLHIGDDLRADFIGARKVGVKSVLIPHAVD